MHHADGQLCRVRTAQASWSVSRNVPLSLLGDAEGEAIGRPPMPGERCIISRPPAFGGMTLVNPACNAFVQDLEIAIPHGVEFLVGQTGQLMGAGSIEDHNSIPGNLLGA